MNQEKVRNSVISHINITHKFLYCGSRNQKEEFTGRITKCFPSIFIIETNNNCIKSFSYNDFAIKNIKIIS